MTRKLFGTDGVRGRANVEPMTASTALRLGQAVGGWLAKGIHRGRVVIGKDTRLSGYMLESALEAGFTSIGMDVFLAGPVPTPAIGMLTRTLRADVGVMISASHNPFEDNGIKLFGPDGFKLSDADEDKIAALAEQSPALAQPSGIGRAQRIAGALERYMEFAKAAFPRHLRLDGLKIVVDCANGAAYRAAPLVLWELGAEIIPIGVSPDGFNINERCGSTDPAHAQAEVVTHGADLGLAFDGDADRLHVIDEKGQIVDGDQIMALIASRWAAAGRLSGGALVTTVMSNMGMERFLKTCGVDTMRTRVGDRYVVEMMRRKGCNVGGEQSGHIILTDFSTTGDGLIAALQVLAALVESGRPASEALHVFEPLPQILRSVPYPPDTRPLDDPTVHSAILRAEQALLGVGRILIRTSGTEPLIRVMAEGEDAVVVNTAVDAVCGAIMELQSVSA